MTSVDVAKSVTSVTKTVEDDDTLRTTMLRRQKNKEAAKRCRERKKERDQKLIADLEKRAKEMEEQYNNLQRELNELKSIKSKWQQKEAGYVNMLTKLREKFNQQRVHISQLEDNVKNLSAGTHHMQPQLHHPIPLRPTNPKHYNSFMPSSADRSLHDMFIGNGMESMGRQNYQDLPHYTGFERSDNGLSKVMQMQLQVKEEGPAVDNALDFFDDEAFVFPDNNITSMADDSMDFSSIFDGCF